MPTIRIDTPYGPLDAKVYAGPTSNLDTAYARDGGHPDRAHTFGRTPVAPYVGARVGSPRDYNVPQSDYEYLTINGVEYSADTSFTLTADGWAIEHGSYGALTRRGTFLTDRAVSDAAAKVWRTIIVPLILDALEGASQGVTQVVAQAEREARAEYVASVRTRIDELRQEAARLESLVAVESMLPL